MPIRHVARIHDFTPYISAAQSCQIKFDFGCHFLGFSSFFFCWHFLIVLRGTRLGQMRYCLAAKSQHTLACVSRSGRKVLLDLCTCVAIANLAPSEGGSAEPTQEAGKYEVSKNLKHLDLPL